MHILVIEKFFGHAGLVLEKNGKCVYFQLYHLENFIPKLSLSIEKSCMYLPISHLSTMKSPSVFFISNTERTINLLK